MFEKELESKFRQIFSVKKVTFNAPGESMEQNCLFIEVENPRCTIKNGSARARVSGSAFLFGENDKLPFGFFAKAIKEADTSLTKDLFFYEIEANNSTYLNLVKRSFSFIYFFNSQYDPPAGTITSVETTVEET